MQSSKFIIDGVLAQALHNYLVRQPFAAVEHLVVGLRRLEIVPPEEPKEIDKSKKA